MRIKGIIKDYRGFSNNEMVIDIGKKEGYKKDPQSGARIGTTLIDNKEFPKVGSTVRIIFREKDKK